MSEKPLNFVDSDTIFIYGDFDDTINTEVLPDFYSLIESKKSKKDSKITIRINSRGGYISVLRSLITAIEQAKSKDIIIETVVEDKAFSCGSLLAVAGTKGHRLMLPFASHLVHYGGSGSYNSKTEIEFSKKVEFLRISKEMDKQMYTYYTKLTNDQIKKLNDQDGSFLFADECIKYGLADKIIGDKKMINKASLNILK